MKEKKQTQAQNNKQTAPSAKKGDNKILFWILGGCLVLLLIGGLVLGGIAYWSYKRVKKEIKANQQRFEQAQNQAENFAPGAEMNTLPSQTSIPETPTPASISEEGTSSEDTTSLYPPAVTEKAMGFIKKVYTKGGKNYLDIDYIQWLMGDAAEKAMREDGQCPKTGECIVYDGYYIRNQNPLIRTYELVPDVEITMQTYDMEATGQIQAQKITLDQFRRIWTSNDVSMIHLKDVPYHIGIGSNKILNISEQYIP